MLRSKCQEIRLLFKIFMIAMVCLLSAAGAQIHVQAADSHTVTYHTNGGASVDVIAELVNDGEYAKGLSTLTKTNYSFEGWCTDAATTSALFDFAKTPITQDIDLYAKWKIDTHTVSFVNPDGYTIKSGALPNAITADYNSEVKLPACDVQAEKAVSITVKYVYGLDLVEAVTVGGTATAQFSGWSYNGKLYTPDESVTVPDKDITLTAVYDANVTAKYNSVTLRSAPSHEGPDVFAGWIRYNGQTGFWENVGQPGETYTPEGETELDASFTTASYFLTYVNNDPAHITGDLKDSSLRKYDYDADVKLDAYGLKYHNSVDAIVNLSYNYSGGQTVQIHTTNQEDADYAAGWKYPNGHISPNNFKMPAHDIILYPNFNVNVTYGSVMLPSPPRTGSSFAGWWTTADDSGTKIGDAGTTYKLTSNEITFYAHWKANSYNLAYGQGTASSQLNMPVPQRDLLGTVLVLPFDSMSKDPDTKETYQVTFNCNGNGDAPIIANASKKTYYTADGWTKVAGSETKDYENFAYYTIPAYDLILYPYFKQTVKTDSVTAPVPVWPDHTFTGWYTQVIGGEKIEGSAYTPDANVTLFAHWTDTATMTYQSADVEMGTVSPEFETIAITKGEAKGSKAKANPGYHFVSWTDQSGTVVSTGSSFAPAKIEGLNVSAAYTANFAPNIYTIKFDGNSGTGKMTDQSLTYGVSTKLSKNSFALTGFSFSNWNTKKDGTGTSYDDAADIAKIALSTVSADNEITLYAQWAEDANVTIKYQSADTSMGTVSPASESVAPATGTAAGSTAEAKPGYHFVSWTNQSGVVVSTAAFLKPAQIEGLNVSATYTANFAPFTYTIKFDGSSGTGTMADQSLTYGVSTKLSKNSFALTGFSFSNWNTKKDGTGTSYEDAADIAKIALNTASAGNVITLYAQWRIDPNTSETRTVIQEGITEVPDELKNMADRDTPSKIDNAMRITINNADSTIPAANIKVYEVKLQFSTDDGKTWIDATKDNFPAEGITFTLAYPNGSNENDTFKITHMFAAGVNAGKTENLSYVKTADGLQVHVSSLSPFAIGYVKKAVTPATPTVTPASSKPDLWCITYLDCKGNTVSVQWVETGKAPIKPAGYSYPDISNVSAHQDVRPASCKVNTKYIVPNTADKSSAASVIR